MKKTLIIIGALILIVVLVLVLSGKKPKVDDLKETVNTNFTVNGGNFYFKPNIIKVKQGDVVSITFKNDEGFHNLIIDEFNVGTKNIANGGEETIAFTADKKGSFEYYCSIGTHRQMGMKGTLIVE